MRFLLKQGGILVILIGIGILVMSVRKEASTNTPYLISTICMVVGLCLFIWLNKLFE